MKKDLEEWFKENFDTIWELYKQECGKQK